MISKAMIDGVKLSRHSKEDALELKKNQRLRKIKTEITQLSGQRTTYYYRGFYFIIFDSGRILINGSLHKYWNNGLHNHNDYSYYDILDTLQSLEKEFGRTILQATIQNLECGLNILLPFSSRRYLESIITLKGGYPAERHPILNGDLNGFEKGLQFPKTDYCLKIYDKAMQNGLQIEMVRHEFKTCKMRAIEQTGISKLSDLADHGKLFTLSSMLIETYENILVAEKLDLDALTIQQQRIYAECCNSSNWRNWNKAKRHKKLCQFEKIKQCFAITQMKNEVSELLRTKRASLLKL